MVNKINVTQGEIRWLLKLMTAHFSYRSCLKISELVNSMFPDSEIAKCFKLPKTKSAYYVVYGLGPYCKEQLLQSTRASPYFSLLFDESLNHDLQKEQMDMQVRFWNDAAGEVQTRYLLFFY